MTWYVVFRGRRPGVYEDWGLCNAQVSSFSHASYKKFKTADQAFQAFELYKQATSVKINDEINQNETTSFLENKHRNLFPWKDVILRFVLVSVVVLVIMYWKK